MPKKTKSGKPVVNTAPTPLNPSPAIPTGTYDEKVVTATLGTISGELSPNPKLTDELVEGEHGTPVRVETAPQELKVTY